MVLTRRGTSSIERPSSPILEDPLVIRHVLLEAAAGDPRRVGRLAMTSRVWWQGSNGSVEQDDELYLRVAESFGWGPGKERIELLYSLRGPAAPITTSKIKQFVRTRFSSSWALHVYSIEAVGSCLDEFYGEVFLNPNKPKFITATDPLAANFPPKTWPGCKVGLTLINDHGDPTDGQGLIFNMCVPKLQEMSGCIDERPGGEKPPRQAYTTLPRWVLQQLMWVALDANLFGTNEDNYKSFLKGFIGADASIMRPFARLFLFACTFDPTRAFTRMRYFGERTIGGWEYLTEKRVHDKGPPRNQRRVKLVGEEDEEDEDESFALSPYAVPL